MLALLALFLWFAFFCFLLFRIVRNRKVSMSLREVIAAYAGKVLFGCLYGYVFLHYFNGDDTWLLLSNSLRETKMLLDRTPTADYTQ